MVYLTGDTHARFDRFDSPSIRRRLTGEDYVIICGDFGGVWYSDEKHEAVLDRLAGKPYTILFADGNHENYDLLATYPQQEWHGGRVQAIRANILHLMRGEIYDIDGRRFFVMGGAACHDLWNGVLDMEAPDFMERFVDLRSRGAFFRIKGVSWWPQEVPTEAELQRGWENLCNAGKRVDVVISHCAPTRIQQDIIRILQNDTYPRNALTDFLQRVYDECSFDQWYCGHYHHPMNFDRLHVLYRSILPLGKREA